MVTDMRRSRGAAWADYNNDGFLDLFVANEGFRNFASDNLLYKNNGDETFTRVTEGEIVNDGGESNSSTWGDYDKDGDLDVFVARGPANNSLYLNNGDGSFAKISAGAIVEGLGFGACWGDIDNDGDLDLFVASRGFTGNLLYTNNGAGTFTRVTTGDIVNDNFAGESGGASWADYDNDGDLDLFVANRLSDRTGHDNFLYRNNGDGTFAKVTEMDIVTDGVASNGASWGDYDNDGDLDLYVTNGAILADTVPGEVNFLYRNDGDGNFTRVTVGRIATDSRKSTSSCWGDYDNDGDLDLFVTNNGNDDFLYFNNGDATFTVVSFKFGAQDKPTGCAAGDYNNDGHLDIFLANLGLPNTPSTWINILLKNDGNSNHWVNINCVGLASPTPEIGTKIRIKATINGTPVWQMREIASQTGTHSQSSPRVHFGLGDATTIDSMKIEWLSGVVDVYTNVAADFFYKAVEGAGLNLLPTSVQNTDPNLPQQFELSQNFPNPFNPATTIKYSLPNSSPVTLRVYNLLGKEVLTLVDNELKQAGTYVAVWDGRNAAGNVVASGLYLLRMQAGNFVQTRKMVLVQ